MKIWIWTLTTLFFMQTHQLMAQQSDQTETNESDILHWVNKKEKKVQFLANSKVLITFQKVKLDYKTGGILYISLENSIPEIKENIRLLELKYPGYEIVRVWTQKNEDLYIDVPSLAISAYKVNTMPGADGPYFQSTFEVANNQISNLEKALADSPNGFLKINGKQVGHREKNVLKERVILPYATCTRLAESKSLFGVIQSYVEILNENKNYPYLYSNTRAQLEKQILVSCLDINLDKELNSFSELLDKSVSLKPNALPPVGETYAKESVRELLPIRFVTKTEVLEEN